MSSAAVKIKGDNKYRMLVTVPCTQKTLNECWLLLLLFKLQRHGTYKCGKSDRKLMANN